ncbi:hypothetical protein MTO96_043848, partial [Rhipicephalus appendiculatus]
KWIAVTTRPRAPPAEEDPNWPQTTASSAEVENSSELVLEDWDPVRFQKEDASPQCLLRIQEDMMDLLTNPLAGVCIEPCPRDYPMRPPRVRLMNPPEDGILNPNLHGSGKVCLDILGTTDTSTWGPAHSIKSVLVAIQSLLTEQP